MTQAKQPSKVVSALTKAGTFVLHLGAAVIVLGIALLMRFGGRELRV
jgi:hypothetical protein